MDAISFVLGVKARDLRGSQLKVRMRGLQMPHTNGHYHPLSPGGVGGGCKGLCLSVRQPDERVQFHLIDNHPTFF